MKTATQKIAQSDSPLVRNALSKFGRSFSVEEIDALAEAFSCFKDAEDHVSPADVARALRYVGEGIDAGEVQDGLLRLKQGEAVQRLDFDAFLGFIVEMRKTRPEFAKAGTTNHRTRIHQVSSFVTESIPYHASLACSPGPALCSLRMQPNWQSNCWQAWTLSVTSQTLKLPQHLLG